MTFMLFLVFSLNYFLDLWTYYNNNNNNNNNARDPPKSGKYPVDWLEKG